MHGVMRSSGSRCADRGNQLIPVGQTTDVCKSLISYLHPLDCLKSGTPSESDTIGENRLAVLVLALRDEGYCVWLNARATGTSSVFARPRQPADNTRWSA